MKIRLLPSNFDPSGRASLRQHLTCFIINGHVALDAGSLAWAVTDEERENVRDIVLTHAHLDHIAGLPLFIDDLFARLDGPVRIHATQEIIDTLEANIFNWSIYPRFSELNNVNGPVVEYRPIERSGRFEVAGLEFRPLDVNHKVPTSGFVISDSEGSIAITGDTAELDDFWQKVADIRDLRVLFIECAFPNELDDIARASFHLTPQRLFEQLGHFTRRDTKVFVINIKPSYRDAVIRQLECFGNRRLEVLESGREYTF